MKGIKTQYTCNKKPKTFFRTYSNTGVEYFSTSAGVVGLLHHSICVFVYHQPGSKYRDLAVTKMSTLLMH